MRQVIRLALLAVIALLLVSVVVGLASSETGTLEKAVLAGAAVLLLLAAAQVRRRIV